MRKIIDPDRKALILAEAELFGDRRTAASHGISDRTIRRWRVDPKLAPLVAPKRRQLEGEWVARLNGTLCATLDKVEDAIDVLPPDCPATMLVLAQMVRQLGVLTAKLNAVCPDRSS